MKRLVTNALIGTFVGITAAVLGACGSDEPETKTCVEWMEDSANYELLNRDEATVDTACWFSTVPLDVPVTMVELRIFEADYKADEACAFSLESTPECDARLAHELTLDEVREGVTE